MSYQNDLWCNAHKDGYQAAVEEYEGRIADLEKALDALKEKYMDKVFDLESEITELRERICDDD